MVKCPTCKATGKMKYTSTFRENGAWKEQKGELTCIDCHGAGEITELKAEQLRRLNDLWCHCKNPSGNVTFHDDASGSKHHWTCDDCGKVTQIG